MPAVKSAQPNSMPPEGKSGTTFEQDSSDCYQKRYSENNFDLIPVAINKSQAVNKNVNPNLPNIIQ